MNIQIDPTSSNLASAMWNSKIRSRAVVGYGVKIFHPSPSNYVTRSPGYGAGRKESSGTGLTLVQFTCRIFFGWWTAFRNFSFGSFPLQDIFFGNCHPPSRIFNGPPETSVWRSLYKFTMTSLHWQRVFNNKPLFITTLLQIHSIKISNLRYRRS